MKRLILFILFFGLLSESSQINLGPPLTAIYNSTLPTLTNGQTAIGQLDVNGRLKINGSDVVQPVSLSSLPLPSGAATTDRQDTGNISLNDIDSTTVIISSQVGASNVKLDSIVSNTNILSTLSVQIGASNVKLDGIWAESIAIDAGVGTLVTVGSTTNAKLDTANTFLTSIDTKLTNPLKTSLPDGNSQAVTQFINSPGQYLEVNTNGASQLTFTSVGAFDGLIAAYGSVEGSQFQNIPIFSWDDFSKQTFSADNNIYSVSVGGFKIIRIKQITLVSGTPTIKAWLSVGNGPNIVTSPNAATLKTQSWLNDGSGSAVNKGQTTSSNSLPVTISSDQTPIKITTTYGLGITYSANITNLVVSTTATDMFTISGSNSKTIKVSRIEISGTEGSGNQQEFILLKRSSADSGGTSTSPPAVPFDSASAAATAVVNAYTVNPTLGTLVGNIRSLMMGILTPTANLANGIQLWEFGNHSGQPIILRGASELLCINAGANTFPSSNQIHFSIEWTEE